MDYMQRSVNNVLKQKLDERLSALIFTFSFFELFLGICVSRNNRSHKWDGNERDRLQNVRRSLSQSTGGGGNYAGKKQGKEK
jgi:hypothetical protein